MLYLSVKALISGLLAATVSEIAKRSPAFGALVTSYFATADFDYGRDLAMARHWGQRAHRISNGSDILVRASVAADVPVNAINVAIR